LQIIKDRSMDSGLFSQIALSIESLKMLKIVLSVM
jgi:hypothetical protein